MLRLVKTNEEDTQILADPRQIMPGRGAYVHLRPACVQRAVRRGGLDRAFRTRVADAFRTELEGLVTQVQQGKR